MKRKYSNDKATLILLALLKAHGIRKVVASPGTTNIALVASMQHDPWFEMYSSVDERSAAYIACGLATSSEETVVITCTEATASRNYFPGLTEAYYRKLPVLVITGTHGNNITGHLHAQSIDRSQAPKDTIRFSISINPIMNKNDEWLTIVDVNKAILELYRHGGGPVHINLHEATSAGFDTQELPKIRKINRITYKNTFPSIKDIKSIIIFIGSHKTFGSEETKLIERFCEIYNAAVCCDITSGYHGKYKILNALLACQTNQSKMKHPDLIIHLGEVSGEIYNTYRVYSKQTWRINEDGEIRDLYRNLTHIFEMDELTFFSNYTKGEEPQTLSLDLYNYLYSTYTHLLSSIPQLPLSNLWIAQQLHSLLPKDSVLHTSIFNSLRSWNFFPVSDTITTNSNVGGFGIDGALSTLLGASLAQPDKIHFGIIGDLAFFYDINALGNRHIKPNIRILLINNGKGTEFRNYDHPAAAWGDDADHFMAAGGHFAKQSPILVKAFAEALGFTYLTASTKHEFDSVKDQFTTPEYGSKPIIFEVFTHSEKESEAIRLIRNIVKDERKFSEKLQDKAKSIAHRLTK